MVAKLRTHNRFSFSVRMKRSATPLPSGSRTKLGELSMPLRHWVRQAERDQGRRPGLTTDERAVLKEQAREIRELRRANEILRKASAYFAQAELDRQPR